MCLCQVWTKTLTVEYLKGNITKLRDIIVLGMLTAQGGEFCVPLDKDSHTVEYLKGSTARLRDIIVLG